MGPPETAGFRRRQYLVSRGKIGRMIKSFKDL
jgi:hypothetical protein